MSYLEIKDRCLIKLFGSDVKSLLQNISTNNINNLSQTKTLYNLLLNSKGRYIFDFFVLSKGNTILLECHVSDKDALIQRLNLYKLQLKVKIRSITDPYKIFVLLNDQDFLQLKTPGDTIQEENFIAFKDPRLGILGTRIICFNGTEDSLLAQYQQIDPSVYELLRIKNTIPDPTKDMIKEASFPLQFNLDKLNAISFNKGCYPGQEVIARMYRATVKKQLYTLITVDETNFHIDKNMTVTSNNIEIGNLLSISKQFALALLNCEKVNDAIENNYILLADTVPVMIFNTHI